MTVPFLPAQLTRAMSSYPVRSSMLNCGFVYVLPGRGEIGARDLLAVAPLGRRLVLELDGQRTILRDLRLAREERRNERALLVADLAAIPDVVENERGRIQVVPRNVRLQVGRLLIVDQYQGPSRRSLRSGCSGRPDDEGRGKRECPDEEQKSGFTHVSLHPSGLLRTPCRGTYRVHCRKARRKQASPARPGARQSIQVRSSPRSSAGS